MTVDERIDRAKDLYERAVFGGETDGLPVAERELDGVEADLALARGRVIHARFLAKRDTEDPRELELFERAAALYRALGDVRGEGEALFWIGIVHQVIRADDDTAVPLFERSRVLAEQADDPLTLSYVLRHLGYVEHAAGRLDAARERFEESTRLRRELGFRPGVAANLVELISIAAEQGRREDALAMADEAVSLAEASGAHRILRYLEETRATL
jgi:tetratricopeptide (TPR) repeat protein